MAAQTETVKLSLPLNKKDAPDGQKDDVFTQWRNRRESNLPPGGSTTRRKSNLKDLSSHLSNTKNMAGLRRMTLMMRAKSDISVDTSKPQVKKENTYKMIPDDGTVFSVAKVTRAVRELLEDELQDVVYNNDTSSNLALELAEKVKDKVKEFNFPRYKIAANVILGQVSDQGMEVASRSVWDHKTDNSACVQYANKDLFAIALVFGVYFE